MVKTYDETPEPKGTRPVVFQTPTLGHAVCLGELYDQRTAKFLGVQLYPKDKIQETETDIRHTELSVRLSTTHEEKASLLDINGSLSLEVLGGLVKVSGSASYLNDSKSNTNEQAFALALKMRLNEKRILFAEKELGRNVLEVAAEDYINDKFATHFVSAIVYGGNFIVNLVAVKSELSMEEKIEGKLQAQFNDLKGAISLEGSIDAEIKGQFNNMNDKFDLVIHGDVALEKVPVNPQDVLDTFPDAASLITAGGGVPMSVTLQPIPKKLIAGSLIYNIDDDFVDEVLKAFSMLDDLRGRFSVLKDSAKNFQEFVPELARITRVIAAGYAKDHGKLLHQLRKFLYDYQHGGEPEPDSIFADKKNDGTIGITGDKVLAAALELYNYHLDPSRKKESSDQYPSSLMGLEKELFKFRFFVSDIQRVRQSLQPPPFPTPIGELALTSPAYLSNIEDVCRAIRIHTTIPLFVMIPLTPKQSEKLNPDLAIVQFLAILRHYAAYFKDPLIPAHTLYAENLGDLELRLPNDGKFAELEAPSIFIGQVDVQGKLSWSAPPLTLERSLELHHQPSAQERGSLTYNIDPVNGTQSFSIQIQAKSPDPASGDNQDICIVQCVKENASFLRFQTPLKVELERNRSTPALITSTEAPPSGQLFTATFVQDIKDCNWILYLDDRKVGEVLFSGPEELLGDSTNLQIAYPASDEVKWWDGEVYKVKASTCALNQEQVASEIHKAGATTN